MPTVMPRKLHNHGCRTHVQLQVAEPREFIDFNELVQFYRKYFFLLSYFHLLAFTQAYFSYLLTTYNPCISQKIFNSLIQSSGNCGNSNQKRLRDLKFIIKTLFYLSTNNVYQIDNK